jgi:bacillopeptidase F (M6 metalloprotease family)
MDSKSVTVAHEFGHNLGLDDSYDPHAMGSLMYGMEVPYSKDFLFPEDRSELLDAYK